MTINTAIKYLAVGILFAAWGAIVFTGKASTPGADTFISWIQIALTSLGVHAAVTAGAPSPQPPQPTGETK